MERWAVILLIIVLMAGAAALAVAQKTAPDEIPGCIYNSTAPSLSNFQASPLQCDTNGRLLTH